MAKKNSKQAAFDKEFREQIEQFTKSVVAALKKITSKKPPSEVKIITFETQSDWSRFPVTVFSMDDESPDEVDSEPPFRGKLLSESAPLVPKGTIDQDAYEEAGVATFERGAKVMAEWFGECWHTAGGAKFPIPAYFNHHDRPHYFDLRKLKWVEDLDIWP